MSGGREEQYQEAVYRVEAVEEGLRADVFLALKAPFLSRTRLKQKIMGGEVRVNGHRLASSTRLRAGDCLELRWRASDDPALAPAVEVLYEDEGLLAVNKPAGLAVHPAGRRQRGTLIQGVQALFRGHIERSLASGDPSWYPSLVNRLDLFSSGVVLIAKERAVLTAMHRLLAAGGVDKQYLVLVCGRLEPAQGRIEEPLGPDEASRIRIKRRVRPDGLPALTEYEVLEYLPGHTLLRARPLTGRQHQLRVHFAHLGHPVWGDLIYADEELFLRYLAGGLRLVPGLPPRHGLHAQRVVFPHPADGRRIEVHAPPPEDLLRVIDGLRAGSAEFTSFSRPS